MGYGLIKRIHLKEYAEAVCDCLGHGKNNKAVELLIETCISETNAGQTKDLTLYAGMGLCQFDKMPFYDIKDRTRQSDKDRIFRDFDIDIDLVEWEHLRYNPLLSLIFARLKYKKIPESIPESVKGRAIYWKQFYNSELGKGTTEHYISAVKANQEFFV